MRALEHVVDRHPRARVLGLDRGLHHREAHHVAVHLAVRPLARPQRPHEGAERPGDLDAHRLLRRGIRGRPVGCVRDLARRLVVAVPERGAVRAAHPPGSVPRRLRARAAPAARVDVAHPALEREDRGGRRVAAVPAPCGVVRLAVDAHGIRVEQVPDGVELVHGHVEQEHVVHLLAEPAEVRGLEELGGDDADAAEVGRPPLEGDEVVVVPARLADHEQLARDLRGRRERQPLRDRERDGLLAEHRDPREQRLRGDGVVRPRDGDVDHRVGPHPRDELAEVGGRLGRGTMGRGTRARRLLVEVDDAHELDDGILRDGLEPRLAHAARADLHDAQGRAVRGRDDPVRGARALLHVGHRSSAPA
ncbi:hypothetical protein BFL35_08455 [Clavibacter michiganensis]|nr:hypothetical protein BFL35_08455 [Clavibacter michiganensis]